MSKRDITQLLNSLQSLFLRIATLNLHTRLKSYRKIGNDEAVHEISGLSEHIEEVAGKASGKEDSAGANSRKISEKEFRKPAIRSSRPSLKNSPLQRGLSGIVKIFRRRSSNYTSNSHLSDQLQRSAREHLNTSLRKARQGDVINARLHADIAGNALHELAHYMQKDEFAKFSKSLSADLKEYRDRDLYKSIVEHTH
ncbi:MAG: hypothetical protein ABFS45_22420 [Pseudomonadota bacterium]